MPFCRFCHEAAQIQCLIQVYTVCIKNAGISAISRSVTKPTCVPREDSDCPAHPCLGLRKYNVSLRILQLGISEPEFYGDLVYRIRKIVGKSYFSEQFRKLINRYKRIGYICYVADCMPIY